MVVFYSRRTVVLSAISLPYIHEGHFLLTGDGQLLTLNIPDVMLATKTYKTAFVQYISIRALQYGRLVTCNIFSRLSCGSIEIGC